MLKHDPIVATELRCGGRRDPLAIDAAARPLLSWEFVACGHDRVPTAFQICLSIDHDGTDGWHNPLWDSGALQWSGLPQHAYGGPPLEESTAYRWRVRVRDENMRWGDWTEARLETVPSRWDANWISQILPPAPCWMPRRPELRSSLHRNSFGALPVLQLRNSFSIETPVRRARLHATARGLYLVGVNGEPCNPGALTPGWTDFHRRIPYQTYDVTASLQMGENVVAATLGEGWFCGRISEHAKYPAGHYGAQPWFLCQLLIEYEDGRRCWVGSNGDWRVSQGPIAYSDLLNGEVFDARQQYPGWMRPGYDDGDWKRVSTRQLDGTALEPDVAPAVSTTQVLKPVAFTRDGDRALADFGQNHSGRLRLRISGEEGAVVRIQHAEILDGNGKLYSANLLRAAQTDSFVCAEGGPQEWEPAFTLHGFRFAELTGLERATLHTIESRVLHSNFEIAGDFACGHSMVDRLQRNIRWGLRSNLQTVPTDCPSRDERLGWLADAQLIAGTAACFFDVRTYFAKWVQDIGDSQAVDGTVPDMAPFISPAFDFFADGAPGWADAAVIVPWTLWQRYADPDTIERSWGMMAAWTGNLERRFPDALRRSAGNNYGDWLAIDTNTDRDLIATAYYAQAARMMADMAEGSGRWHEAERYRALKERIRGSFRKTFIREDGTLSTPTQAAYAIAIGTGVIPPAERCAMADRLADTIVELGGALSTGFLGTRYLMAALSEHGHARLAYDLLLRTEYPSWGHMIAHGATTCWERWDSLGTADGPADPTMNSFNHAALGSVGQWLFEDVAGIRGDTPGWGAITIRPNLDARLGWCEASQRTACGLVRVRWEYSGHRVNIACSIPTGATAQLYLPAESASIAGDSAMALRPAMRKLGRETAVILGSGSYALDIPAS